MHASLNTNCSVRDFHYLDLDTQVGRAQIRQELEEEFRVPEEVVDWFFEQIDARIEPSEELATVSQRKTGISQQNYQRHFTM